MYSGTTLTRMSGRVVGAHQKIDRVARKHLGKLINDQSVFPQARKILQFEGKNGPDAIKRKSPAKDEPWHYTNPFDDDDNQLEDLIAQHFDQLVVELKNKNTERTAFEAAWLAHAVVDGLTPAHHYPYEQKLVELRNGKGIETRTTYREKLIMPGDTVGKKVKNNWKMWGPRGLIMSHMMFEFGVAAIISPLGFGDATPTKSQVKNAVEIGPVELFRRAAKEVAVLDMYEHFHKKGWTPKLAWQVRHKLGPTVVQTVTLSWYLALREAGMTK
jgi:hypothetical protein